ncbi:maker194 [Drosophila busckii]|uniref:Maker194 n=1 Tax=Drosophila busckii TaxID=30019 RepID=A0A0M4F3T7_DROBS|nr:maker194 [Drosophila busckii]
MNCVVQNVCTASAPIFNVIMADLHSDFKCAVCFSPVVPTIKAKDPNMKHMGNLRDYYELSYHVLGETHSLIYYRRFDQDQSVNKSISCNALSDIVLETKCSECSYSVAHGECKDCDAFYCKRCFETVHNHSNVLKKHLLQRLNDKGATAKGIRVGKHVYRLPGVLQCSIHNRPANIYCKNQRYTTEVPSTVNALNTAILEINNAQQVSNAFIFILILV